MRRESDKRTVEKYKKEEEALNQQSIFMIEIYFDHKNGLNQTSSASAVASLLVTFSLAVVTFRNA